MEPFYLYGTFSEGSDTLSSKEFSFVVDSYREIKVPSFLIWLYRDTDERALLCKVRKVSKPADLGMKVDVYDAVPIKLIGHGLLNTLYPNSPSELGLTAKEHVSEILSNRSFLPVPDDQSAFVKTILLKNNIGVLDESYFVFDSRSSDAELVVEATDAIHTGLRIFGIPAHSIPELREQQILDFDIATIFSDAAHLGVTPDGKQFFRHGNRRLYLHKVDRTPIEECLGVDLIYNYIDQRRLVFVQYKCQKAKGKYYPQSDRSHESEVQRMAMIPGLDACLNLLPDQLGEIRLCRCPVFIKLCKKEIANAHAVPIGVYYPLCVWRWHTERQVGMSVRDEPHINSQQFQDLVKTGLIGSTSHQSTEIQNHLVEQANDSRLKLIFEEESVNH